MALPDDFNRADNALDLGSEWDTNTAYSGGLFGIASNAAFDGSGNDSCETYNARTWANDQWAEATLKSPTASGVGVGYGVVCRCATAAKDNYRAVGNASGYEFGVTVSGTFTSLSSGTGTTFADQDKIKLQITGTGAWTLYKNGTQFASGTDTTTGRPTSGRAGVFYSSFDASAGGVDAFDGGDVGGGGGPSNTLMGQACL